MPVAVITGASRGFGRALAVDLAKDGWDLVIDARRSDVLGEVGDLLESLGVRVSAMAGDVTDPDHRVRLIEAARSFGELDLLVNNASALGPSPLPTLDRYPLESLRMVYEANVFAPLALVQLALPMLRSAHGTIVSISSDAAVEGYEGWGGYGSSKAALDQLHHVLASEEPGLRVFQFDPGDMRTELHAEALPDEDPSALAEPESVVPALRKLLESASPSARYRAAEWGAS